MTPAERAYAEARTQGLPERVEDPSALALVAQLILDAEAGDRHGAA